MRLRPRIGLTTSARDEEGRFRLHGDYVDAVRRAGGLAVLLPPGDVDATEVLAFCDAVVMTGGGDVDPKLYGGLAHAEVYGVDAERDASEVQLARALVKTRRPALLICRGMQVLNVALGGTLMEHVPDETDGSVAHRGTDDYVQHDVEIEADCALATVLGARVVETDSWHHQAVRTLAPGTRAVARSSDGLVEALEVAAHPLLLAVQWHPEHSAASDPRHQRMFDALVAAARGPRA